MANSFASNITRRLMKGFMKGAESARIMSKNVNTQKLSGKFNPSSGTIVDFKRPTDYRSDRTAAGDISALTASDITTGKASGTVQDYFTVFVSYDEVDQALQMDEEDALLMPMGRRIVTDVELDFARFMAQNTGLVAGAVGTPATTWDHVANGGATLSGHGVPMDKPWFYAVNPYTQATLASDQRGLGSGGASGKIITEAHQKATLTERFAGFDRVMTATTLASHTTDAPADRAGTLTAAPDPTYLTAKDTMTQTLAVTALGANLVVYAGETIQITGPNRLNLSTRTLILDAAGNTIPWTGTVTADVTLDGAGAGNIVVTGPAIFEATGAFNTVDAAAANGAVVTLLGAASTVIQPNLFWYKDAFSIGSVPLKKLHSTDTIAKTEDGLTFRVSKYSDGAANSQTVRFDFLPAYAVLNPFYAGQSFG